MNILADFPSERFAIIAHCLCGHAGRVETSRLPQELAISALERSLRCADCGARASGIRIVWIAAGGYAHGG
jgi:hypothetical protein